MDLDLLKTFLVLAETKNFTHAAKKLYRSQSAISLQLARLERWIGKSLFVRDNRNVSMTLEGEQFLGYAKRMLQLEAEMLHHFHQPQLTGEVVFGTPEDLATAYLPGILSHFIETYPRILLNVHCEFTVPLLKGFEEKTYDLVLIKQDPQNPHPKSELAWKESLVWVWSGHKSAIQINSESVIPLVLSPSPCVYRQRAIDALNRDGIRWRMIYTSPSLAGTIAAVRAGLGMTVLPINMVPEDLQICRNLPLLKDAQIALLKQDYCSDAVKALAYYIVNHIR